MSFKIPEMGAIKPHKSENVKNRIYRDESDKINGTFWDRNFEGPKSTVNGFIGAEDCAEGSGVHSIGKKTVIYDTFIVLH